MRFQLGKLGLIILLLAVPVVGILAQSFTISTPDVVCSNDRVTLLYSQNVVLGSADRLEFTQSVNSTPYVSGLEYGPNTNLSNTITRFSDRFTTQTSPYTFSMDWDLFSGTQHISRTSMTTDCVPPGSLGTGTKVTVMQSTSQENAPQSSPVHVPAIPPDDRLNWQYGDSHIGILYSSSPQSIDLYLYEGEEYIANFITADDIAAYADAPPTENILIKRAGDVDVYLLTTGELQFNLYDVEGKMFTYITADFEGTDDYGSYIDPGE